MKMSHSFSRARPWVLGTVLVIAAWTLNGLGAQSQTKQKHLVDVNSANVNTLETLPGITPTLAQRIVDNRPYNDLTDLAKVKGLGSAKLNGIKDDITFGPAATAPKGKSTKSSPKTSDAEAAGQPTPVPAGANSSVATERTKAPKKKDTEATPSLSPTGAGAGQLAPGQTVNINKASLEELDALPGIGPTKAQAIIDYRTEHGPFNAIEDIQNVKGIKAGEFSKLKDHIRVK
jgi:competence protein ComEA